jgi:DNA-binding GntR family transcriptional regulator
MHKESPTPLIRQPKDRGARAREEMIYDEIHRAIAERRLLPGAKLTEEALCEVFDVSRARIRKVLLLLAKENVVDLEPNRGAFVWKPTVRDARNVLDARRVIELEVVNGAVAHASAADFAELRRIIAEEKKALAAKDYSRSMRLSGEFHMALARSAQNPILTEFLTGLISRSYLILASYQKRDSEICPQTDHEDLIKLIEKRDLDGALSAQRHHFAHIESELDLSKKKTSSLSLKQIFYPDGRVDIPT